MVLAASENRTAFALAYVVCPLNILGLDLLIEYHACSKPALLTLLDHTETSCQWLIHAKFGIREQVTVWCKTFSRPLSGSGWALSGTVHLGCTPIS